MAEENKNESNTTKIQEEIMTKMDALLLIAFNIFLPTFDVYSDIVLSVGFIRGTKDKRGIHHPKFGLAILTPVFLSFLFLIPQWLKIEDNKQKRLKTLPLLFMQIWPQYRVVKLLYYGFKRNPKYANKKAIYDKDLSSIGEKILDYIGWLNTAIDFSHTEVCFT